jgi:hypothetical protein
VTVGRAPDPKALVHLRVDLDALRRGSLSDGEVCEIPGVGPVPVQTARDLLGDALCDLVITNGTDITTVCHLGRSIPRALNTALIERDRHCVVPGCDVTKGLERDHWIVSFVRGGPATIENPAGVESVMSELIKLVADDIEPYDSVHPSTMNLYRSLTRRRSPTAPKR